MARIIENMDGKRKMIKLSTDDVMTVVREYQRICYNCNSYQDIRSSLSDYIIYLPEEI